MVDTVRIRLGLPVRPELWGRIKSLPDIILGDFDVSSKREKHKGVKVRVYRLTNSIGVSLAIINGVLTQASASIPRVLFDGNNTRLIRGQSDIDRFLMEMMKVISEIIEPEVPIKFDFTRVDLVAYIQLPVVQLRAAFRDAKYPLIRNPPIDYVTQGFSLPGSLLRVNFYDKELKQKKPNQGRTRCEFQLRGRLLRKAITGDPTTRFSHLDFNQLRDLYIFLVGLFPTPLREVQQKKYVRNELLGILSQCECPGFDMLAFVDGQFAYLKKGSLRNARKQAAQAAINFANLNLLDWLRPSGIFREINYANLDIFAQRLVPSMRDELPELMSPPMGASSVDAFEQVETIETTDTLDPGSN
jgi:hypothetical protein